MRKLLAALLIAVAVQASLVLAGRHKAGRTQFPHQAWLNGTSRKDGQPYHCAGALISEQWVISSAYCVADLNYIYVHLGTFYLPKQDRHSYMLVSRAVMASWVVKSFDLALVMLSDIPKKNKGYIAPIRLPPKSYATKSYSLWKATFTEYDVSNDGDEESQVSLVYSKVRVEPNFLCRKQYEFFEDDENFCLLSLKPKNEEKTCTRDAGSPLIVTESDGKPTLLGVAATTESGSGTSSCGTLFVKIAPHLDWIRKETGISLRKK